MQPETRKLVFETLKRRLPNTMSQHTIESLFASDTPMYRYGDSIPTTLGAIAHELGTRYEARKHKESN